MYDTFVRVMVSAVVADGHRTRANFSCRAFAFAGSDQSAQNVYSG